VCFDGDVETEPVIVKVECSVRHLVHNLAQGNPMQD
jgi:hypothetical protein